MNYDKKILLYSGGMDSWLIDKIWKPDIKLYINMHTRYSEREIQKLPTDVIIEDLDLGKWEREDAIIPLRNLFLIALATNYGNTICIGATAGDRVLDKSLVFQDLYEELLNYLYQKQHWTEKRKIILDFSFKSMTKIDILKQYLLEGGDINKAFTQSFSCYNPDIKGNECWCCKACFRKFVTFAECGYLFPDKILEKVIPYIGKEIIPQIITGIYNRDKREEEAIMHIYKTYKQFDK